MKKKKNAFLNLSYSVLAVVIMNAVLQIAVYPSLNKILNSYVFGDVLYLLGIVAILAPAFGLALNNTRLVVRNQYETKNGDYNKTLLLYCLISCIVGLIAAGSKINSIGSAILFILLICFTAFRYYADVSYRLTLNYKKYLIYYLIISAGYLIGIFLFKFINNWFIVFLLAEVAAVVYSLFKNTIYQKPFESSQNGKQVFKSASILACSYLVYNLITNADRIILLNIIGNIAVSEYYVVSLIGKTLALLVGPLNSIVISYLTKSGKVMTRPQYLKITLLVILLSVVSMIFSICATPLFVQIFYPTLYSSVGNLVVIVSISQTFCFAGSLMLTIILTICSEKWQLWIQCGYAFVFIALALPITYHSGILGFAFASLVANTLRLLVVIFIGFKYTKTAKEGNIGSIL